MTTIHSFTIIAKTQQYSSFRKDIAILDNMPFFELEKNICKTPSRSKYGLSIMGRTIVSLKNVYLKGVNPHWIHIAINNELFDQPKKYIVSQQQNQTSNKE